MNKVVHFEVPYDDKERAKKFYHDVFDWRMQDMPEMDYVIAHSVETDENQMPKESGAINGGMYERGEGVSKHPVLVLEVEDIDQHVKKIEQAGGKLVKEKMQVGDMGYYAQVSDTEENIIGIWQNI